MHILHRGKLVQSSKDAGKGCRHGGHISSMRGVVGGLCSRQQWQYGVPSHTPQVLDWPTRTHGTSTSPVINFTAHTACQASTCCFTLNIPKPPCLAGPSSSSFRTHVNACVPFARSTSFAKALSKTDLAERLFAPQYVPGKTVLWREHTW
jgi:hypothetical protein